MRLHPPGTLRACLRRVVRSAAGLLLVACGGGPGGGSGPPDLAPGRLEVSPSTPVLAQRDSLRLVVTVSDQGGDPMPNTAISLTSLDKTRISITPGGAVWATGRAGHAPVRVRGSTDGGSLQTDIDVEVEPVPDSIEVAPLPLRLAQGGSLQLATVVRDMSDQIISGLSVSFTAIDADRVSVTSTGLLRSLGPTGPASIRIEALPAVVNLAIQVDPTPAAIVPAADALEFAWGQASPLEAVVVDLLGDTIPGVPLSIRSDHPALASVRSGQPPALVGHTTGAGTVTWEAAGVPSRTVPFVVTPPAGLAGRASTSGPAYAVAINPEGEVLAATYTSGVDRALLPALPFAALPDLPGFSSTTAVALSGDWGYATGLPARDQVARFPAGSGSVVAVSPAFIDDLLSLLLAPDGSALYVGTLAGEVLELDPMTLALRRRTAVGGLYVNHLAVDAPRDRLFASMPGAGKVMELSLADLSIVRMLELGGAPQAVVPSSDGEYLYVAHESGTLGVWKLADVSLVAEVPSVVQPFDLAISASGAWMWATSSTLGTIQAVRLADLTVQRTWYPEGVPLRIGVASFEDLALVANLGGWVDFIAP